MFNCEGVNPETVNLVTVKQPQATVKHSRLTLKLSTPKLCHTPQLKMRYWLPRITKSGSNLDGDLHFHDVTTALCRSRNTHQKSHHAVAEYNGVRSRATKISKEFNHDRFSTVAWPCFKGHSVRSAVYYYRLRHATMHCITLTDWELLESRKVMQIWHKAFYTWVRLSTRPKILDFSILHRLHSCKSTIKTCKWIKHAKSLYFMEQCFQPKLSRSNNFMPVLWLELPWVQKMEKWWMTHTLRNRKRFLNSQPSSKSWSTKKIGDNENKIGATTPVVRQTTNENMLRESQNKCDVQKYKG